MEKHSWQLIKFYSLYFQSRLYRAVRQDRHLRDGERYNGKMGAKRRSFPKKKWVNDERRVKETRLMTAKGYEKDRRGNRNVDEVERENKGRGNYKGQL